MTKRKNNRGQAVIEALLVLMPVFAMVAGLVGVGYVLFADEWCDYWNYRATLCMIKTPNEERCREELEQHIALVVKYGIFKVDELWKTPKEASAKSQLTIPLAFKVQFRKSFKSSVRLPLDRRF